MITRIGTLLLVLLMSAHCAPAEEVTQEAVDDKQTVRSPGNINQIHFELVDGRPVYSVTRFGRDVVKPSPMGFVLQDIPDFDEGFEVTDVATNMVDKTWEQVWGQTQYVQDHHNELRITLTETEEPGRELIVVFRAFDDGIGFRYEFPEQEELHQFSIMDELTEFRLTGDHESWYIDAYQWNRFEYYFENTPLSEADTVHTPLTMRTKDDLYLTFHEAALVDFSTMTLERIDDYTLKSNLMPWAEGDAVRVSDTRVTPWRTILLADDPGDLITSKLILNLNEPNKLNETDWIEPGKYIGIWWGMHIDKYTWYPGEKLGATTENAKRYIDFAADHGFDHVLVEGWNPGWDEEWFESGVVFDFTRPIEEFDLEAVAGYALENGTRLMGHHETSASVLHYEDQMEEAYQLYEDLGVRAVKTGYVGHGTEIVRYGEDGEELQEWHHGQFMVNHHRDVIELAAEHQIMLNVHEGVKSTGLRRTYPNMMTSEVAKGQEYNAWGEAGGNPPEHTAILPFTRNLAGPFDYTPGVVDLHFDEYQPDNRIKSTLAKELALYITIFSPLHMAADLPENYEDQPEALRFIKHVSTDWYDTKVLHASIGNYVTIARKDRHSEDWFLGSITDDSGRNLKAPLNFLDPGTTYVAEIYRDGKDADWEENPYDMVYEEKLVDSSMPLVLRLATSGGQAIRFRPADDNDLDRLD